MTRDLVDMTRDSVDMTEDSAEIAEDSAEITGAPVERMGGDWMRRSSQSGLALAHQHRRIVIRRKALRPT